MKRIIIILLCILPMFTGCKKIRALSDYPFTTLDVSRIRFDMVYLEIIPENNDFYYHYEVVEEDYFKKFGSEKALIADIDNTIKKDYNEYFYKYCSFEDLYLYKGMTDANYYELKPSTNYYLVAYGYNDDLTTFEHVSNFPFRTPDKKESNIQFDITVQGTVITVTPSNNDQYFWEYDTIEEIENNYFGSPVIYYDDILDMYWQYEFMPGMEDKGVSTDDMNDYFTMEPGKQFYLCIAGYDLGVTSKYHCYKITYVGENEPGIVEDFKDPIVNESYFDSVATRKQVNAKAQFKRNLTK